MLEFRDHSGESGAAIIVGLSDCEAGADGGLEDLVVVMGLLAGLLLLLLLLLLLRPQRVATLGLLARVVLRPLRVVREPLLRLVLQVLHPLVVAPVVVLHS